MPGADWRVERSLFPASPSHRSTPSLSQAILVSVKYFTPCSAVHFAPMTRKSGVRAYSGKGQQESPAREVGLRAAHVAQALLPVRALPGAPPFAFKGGSDLVAQSAPLLRRNVYLQDDLRGVNKVELSPLNKVSGPGAFVAPPSRRPTWHRHSCLCALCCHSEERAALVAATRKCPSMRRLCACWGGEIPGSFRSAGLQPGILGLANKRSCACWGGGRGDT